jgi:hypothetical protein
MKIAGLVLLLVSLLPAEPASEILPADSSSIFAKPPDPAVARMNRRTPGKAALISLGSMVALVGTGSAIMVAWDPGRSASATENIMLGTGGTLIATGIILAPSTGQVWMRNYGHASLAALLRASGATLLAVCVLCSDGSPVPIFGIALYLSGLAYSFVQPFAPPSGPGRVASEKTRVEFFPIVARNSEGRLHPGLIARMRF